MKKILSLIILFFFINNCSESYNKSDLQMYGVILGQSLLDHLDEKQIKDLQIDWATPIKNDKIKTIVLERNNSDIFKNLEIDFKNDSSYKILVIRSIVSCEEIKLDCKNLFSEFLSQTTKRFPGARRVDEEDQTGIPGKFDKFRSFKLKDATINIRFFNIQDGKPDNTYLFMTMFFDEIREYTK
jgi:hypothetical protein